LSHFHTDFRDEASMTLEESARASTPTIRRNLCQNSTNHY
jgi:hypothetical protein